MPLITIDQFQAAHLDYLVVGGGTAGLTLAARLSEDESMRVGVIEAGGYDLDVPETDIPGYLGRNIANPAYDWTFLSAPQSHAGGTPVLQPRGKGLGGSSALNFLGMCRPSKEELDALEGLRNKGWNWASLLEYMKKSETAFPSNLSSSDAEKYAATPDPGYHGTKGPIKKSFAKVWMSSQALLFDTAEKLGVSRNGEMGNGSNVGSMSPFNSIDPRTSRRSYSASAYYEPNAIRSNLLVLINSRVCKVLLEPKEDGSRVASGVEVISAGKKVCVKGVKKDVILSAGTFQTPQLLELSGIGNPEILRRYGITPVIELPGVGENLQDHICVHSIVEIDANFETMDVLLDPHEADKHLRLYNEQREGLFSSCPAMGFIFLSSPQLRTAKEELQLWQTKADASATRYMESIQSTAIRTGLQKQYNLQKVWFQKHHLAQAEILKYNGHQPGPDPVPVPGKRYTSLVGALLHSLSRGTVHIGSSDPLAPPIIDPNYFANKADLDLLVHIFSFIIKLIKMPPFADITHSLVLPAFDITGAEDELVAKMREYAKKTVGPVFHPVGTAAMLPFGDGGVVDNELKVYGTSNLRVVNASILLMELACHIQSVVYAIAEKAADIFKQK